MPYWAEIGRKESQGERKGTMGSVFAIVDVSQRNKIQ